MYVSSDSDIGDILSAIATHPQDPAVVVRGCTALAAHKRVEPATVMALGGIDELVRAMQMHQSAQHHELQMWVCLALEAACNKSSHAIGRMLHLGGIDLVISAMDMHIEHESVQLAAGQLLLGLSVEEQACDAIQLAGGADRVERAMAFSNADPLLVKTVGPALLGRLSRRAAVTAHKGEILGEHAPPLGGLAKIAAAIYEAKEQVQEEAAREVRQMLSKEDKPPIQDVIDAGLVPRLIEFLSHSRHPTLQFEAAWALTNIVSGTSEHVEACVKLGLVPKMIELLDSSNEDVREQAAWALGNIAGDSAKMRDEVLKQNVMTPLLRVLDPKAVRISLLRQGTWALSNLCRGKPQPPFDLVEPAITTLATLVHSSDEELLTDACWALSYLSDGTNDKIQAVIDAGVCGRLAELLLHKVKGVVTPALRGVGNIVTGDDEHTQAMIDCGVLPSLHKLLSHSSKSVRKEACWALSNIAAGSKEQLQAVIDHKILRVLGAHARDRGL